MIEQANLPKNRMWSRCPAEERRLLTVHIQRVEHVYGLMLLGRICVQNKLPAGDPCWMARMIGSYADAPDGTGGYYYRK
jgi:hypothetical protein